MMPSLSPAIRLYIGGLAAKVRGIPVDQAGYRCYTAAWSPRKIGKVEIDPNEVIALLDSGAFTDIRDDARLTPEQSLERQLRWERDFSEMCGSTWRAEMLASYDRLIDEKLVNGERKKIRWSVREGESAVVETIEAARYLASRQRDLWPRSLVLAAQGVDEVQYAECVAEILRFADPDDTIGLGGWCILGRRQRLLPVFKRTVETVAPMIARAGLSTVHIFGVLWEPALAYLLAVADEHQLGVSTDSSKPVISVTWSDPRKAGVRSEELTADANVAWWINHLARLRETAGYARAVREREAGIWRARVRTATDVEWAAEQADLFKKAA
jgi:hypothetical protein